ncbi:hypothetical protein LOTGIDRAFT_137999 [Lottia gigantea]|uniref:Lipoxygenase domain-containing protein n=1 Tax=Lottia gigantea TaxID=225164 RepID=V4CKG7_LOTGI|nr:hypothetical protein LOTGIDRAFT_137999 [Lottia gigantea]ESP02740.1 hypothetical protein LOTGIDRAFT_137999 [Lottia gigantea]
MKADYLIYVGTGDKKNAGTDANVKIILEDEEGQRTGEIELDNFLKNDFEAGKLDVFPVDKIVNLRLGNIAKIEFWRDNSGAGSHWFVDRILVENRLVNTTFAFPVFRWIQPNRHYIINHLDTSLPQFDTYREQRAFELAEKKKAYEYTQKAPGMPVQWDLLKSKINLKAKSKFVALTSGRWNTLDDLINVYDKNDFPPPKHANGWKDDVYFGNQRLASQNSTLIKLCTSIPEKLAVTEDMLKPLLEGNSLQSLIDDKRLFIVDLDILEDLDCKDGAIMCSPIALFMVDNKKQLRPIAIQLFQQPGTDNPVFLPTDDPNLWIVVKMWFNNADSTYHQSLTHLGYTHLIMEGICICGNRNLSLSHPIFKLLAPHFLFLIAINNRALQLLVSVGGWVDKTMNCGAKGLVNLMTKGVKNWSMVIDGNLKEDLKKRGVDDPNVLPGYHYRDDALLLYDAIQNYTSKYVDLYYDSEETIAGDDELQSFAKEMALEIEKGGGVPNNGVLKTKKDIVDVVSCVIYTCSVSHAAANFPQYHFYSFPPNCPVTMNGTPPKTKDPVDADFMLKTQADKDITLDIMIVTKLLSNRGTQSLGDFEVQYIFDPNALKLVSEFRQELKKISQTIKDRNKTREFKYDYLDPESIPNSIGI